MYKYKHSPQVYIYDGTNDINKIPDWLKEFNVSFTFIVDSAKYGGTQNLIKMKVDRDMYEDALYIDKKSYFKGAYIVLFMNKLNIYLNEDGFLKDFETIK